MKLAACCLSWRSQLYQTQRLGQELVRLELEQKCGRRMKLPAQACWHPPTAVTARISRRDMLAAAEEEVMNGIGGETWIFFLLHKMRGCCWEHKGGEGIATFLLQLNTREGQSMEQ